MARLIVFAGLPGVGKSTIARELAGRIGAVWLRIDSLDQAIWASGTAPRDLRDWTYRAAQAVAEDNLRLGSDVIGDCVNDWTIARDGWQEVGRRAGADVIWLEIVCGDLAEHRRRVENRVPDIPSQTPPDWAAVAARDYHAWDRERITIDTAAASLDDCLTRIFAAL